MLPDDYRVSPDLPADIADRLRAADADSLVSVIDAAYEQLDFPDEGVPPRAESLTPAQLALATTLLECSLWSNSNRSRLPCVLDLSRWLGREPAGPLEELTEISLDGAVRREPVWRAVMLMTVRDGEYLGPRVRAFLDALPVARRYQLWALCNLSMPAPWQLDPQVFFPIDSYADQCAHLVTDDAGAWAATFLDALLEVRKLKPNVGTTLLPFLAAVRAGIVLEPRWDVLLPRVGRHALVDECVLSIPAERRVAAVLTWLSKMLFPSEVVNAAIRVLPHVPDPAIVQQALQAIPKAGGSERLRFKALREAAGDHAELLALIDTAEAAKGPPKVLTVLAVRTPKTLEVLSAEDQAQLQIAGKRYHGKNTSLESLMSDDPNDEEESLRFGLTYVALGDAKGKHMYDAWLYRVDSGCIFAKGKPRVVAERVQFSIQCKDDKLADGLETALREPLQVSSPPKEPAKKRRITKKT